MLLEDLHKQEQDKQYLLQKEEVIKLEIKVKFKTTQNISEMKSCFLKKIYKIPKILVQPTKKKGRRPKLIKPELKKETLELIPYEYKESLGSIMRNCMQNLKDLDRTHLGGHINFPNLRQ